MPVGGPEAGAPSRTRTVPQGNLEGLEPAVHKADDRREPPS